MTLISQQCRAKCSKGARQSSIRGMKSQLASPRARESLFWGWDRAGSSKAAKRAAVRGTAKAWDHWGQCQTEKHCTALVLSSTRGALATEPSGAHSTAVPIAIPQAVTVLPDNLAVPKGDDAE